MEPLSIVHLCAPAHVGGLERVVQLLASSTVALGHQVAVVAVVEPGADSSDFLGPMERAGVRTIRVEVAGRGYLREWREVGRVVEDIGPDVIHSHGYRPDLLHGFRMRRRGIATVSTLHGSSRMGGLSRIFEWMQERALAGFDAVVAVSAPLVGDLQRRGVSRGRIHLIPNGWAPPDDALGREEARRALGAEEGKGPLVGWVGRIIPIKGCDLFVEALATVADLPWQAVVVGDGPEREGVVSLARQRGLSHRIRFPGALPEAARYLTALDLFVLSSRSEGTPMVLLEAMGAGIPVVATPVGGVPDVVGGPDFGWIAPAVDPGKLGEGIRSALEDAEARQRRGAEGARRVRELYDRAAWARRHLEVYRAAMGVRSGRPTLPAER